jgi:hypothetical protein
MTKHFWASPYLRGLVRITVIALAVSGIGLGSATSYRQAVLQWPIVAMLPSDLTVVSPAVRALKAAGIDARVEGSRAYSVRVATKDKRRAVRVLRRLPNQKAITYL